MEWDYKIRPDSDHVAKFQGDRSRELGERMAKKKHLGQNISPSGTAVPGGLDTRITMLELGSGQNMTGMETKRARGKCIANALVCQLC